jgi:primase-polymerase (primpol)-like protein
MSENHAGDLSNGTMEVNAPPALKSSNHWVLRNGKKPANREGDSKGWSDPSFWMTLDEALDAFQSAPSKFSGLGYIVEYDPARGDSQIIGGDLDNCRDPITGWISLALGSSALVNFLMRSIRLSGMVLKTFPTEHPKFSK